VREGEKEGKRQKNEEKKRQIPGKEKEGKKRKKE